ncbi:MAG: transporter substrate-binding domain-containing protein [Smithellaceae bacterium]|nr:transporter substrate-binding domain-containing protein [Smithellaceae bacterium]
MINHLVKKTCLPVSLVLATFLCFPTSPSAASGRTPGLTFMTEQYPPFNFEENGSPQGIAVDLLAEIMKKANVEFSRSDIHLKSWTTGYQAALNNKNTAVFSTTRTPERERLFRWVGPIAPTKIVVIARKDRALKINTFADLKKLRIAALCDDIGEQLLLRGKIKNNRIIVKEKADDVIRLLEAGKVDAWAYEETAGMWLIKHLASNPGNFESIYPLGEGELYYAFNRQTSESVIQTMGMALDELKKEKTKDGYSIYEKVFDHYLKPRYIDDRITNEQVMRLVDQTMEDLAADAPATIDKINAGTPPYRDKDNPSFYVFIYDTAITMVAHGDNIKLVGKNFKGKTDVNGKAFRDEIVASALRDGSGWEDYVYTSPGESGLYYKTTFFMRARGSDGKTYIVCSGKFKDK